MPNYRRWWVEGGTYFFTLVAHQRRQIFAGDGARKLLHEAISGARARRPFELTAMVLLPDHLHMIMRLPEDDGDFARRIGAIKYTFTRAFLRAGGDEAPTTTGRRRHRNRGVWQKRFYEHCIRGYRDFKRHLDYIHVNPVKHGLAEMPAQWPWSSFGRYVGSGEYDEDWCGRVELPGADIEPDTW